MESDFNYFMDCFMIAGERINHHYFQLPVAGSEEPIYRERVYCYELYHQLRCVLGDGFPYKLNGEVDKNGHRIIRPELGPKKPDFVVHDPGNMNQNLVVIEVKPITVKDNIRELRDDINTLIGFLNKAKYYRAIMLVYGNEKNELPANIIPNVKNSIEGYVNRIALLWHSCPMEKPIVVKV